ncbi:hypothetical protein EON63_15130 [archaeon]|nr:MAG: hypothetical protein EON63_15130 [archaeon]
MHVYDNTSCTYMYAHTHTHYVHKKKFLNPYTHAHTHTGMIENDYFYQVMYAKVPQVFELCFIS